LPSTRFPFVGDVRSLRLMVALDLVQSRDPYVPDLTLRDNVVQAAIHQGLLLLGCGESAIRFCPPLCINAEQVETALSLLERVLESQGNGAGT
jgi:4-aminobutyrate aminotransferase